MHLKTLTPELSILPQPNEAEIAQLARRGYKSLIGNRPDGEAADQPAWASLAEAAKRHGMDARHIPIVASQVSKSDIEQFREALRVLPKPIAAFCRSGTRSVLLWALAKEAELTVDERIRIAAREGFDLKPFRARLEA